MEQVIPQTRRSHRRYDVNLAANARVLESAIDIDPEMLDPTPVQITNLSLRGMHLRAQVPYPVESEIVVHWQVAGERLAAVGRIRYRLTEFQDGKTLYGCGISLENDAAVRQSLPLMVESVDLEPQDG